MRAVFLIAWRNLSERPARTLLSASGVILGVALILSILIATRSVERDLLAIGAGDAGEAALMVLPEGGRQTVSESLVAEIAAIPGVAQVLPQIRGAAGIPVAGAIVTLPFFAVNSEVEGELRTYRLAEGIAPGDAIPGVAVGQRWAEEHGIAVGDSITLILGPMRRLELPVTGYLAPEGLGRHNGSGVLLLNLTAYQEALGREGQLTRILVTLAPRAKVEAVEAAIDGLKPGEAVAIRSSAAQSGASSLRMGLNFFGGVGALVGAFLIFGAFTLALRQRTVQTGVTLAVGATPLQVTAAMTVEALGVGLAGGLTGIPLGAALSLGMLRLVASNYGGRVFDRIAVAPADLLISLGAGLAVTLAAALVPAWRAARVSPVEALRAASGSESPNGYGLAALGLAMALIGLFGWQWGMRQDSVMIGQAFTLGYYVGVSLAIPRIVRWSVRYLLEPAANRLGVVTRLAAGNLARNIDRATMTVSGMMVAIAMLISFSAVATSFWKGAEEHVLSTMSGDLSLQGDLTPGILTAARSVPGVAALSPEGGRWIESDRGWAISAYTIDPEEARKVLPFRLDQGDRDEAFAAMQAGGALILSARHAEKYGIKLGDTVRFQRLNYRGDRLPASFHEMQVVGLINVSFNNGRVGYISLQEGDQHFGGSYLTRAYVKLAPGADPNAVAAALRLQVPQVSVQDFTALKAEMRSTVAGEMSSFRAMLYIALIMSALGIINTLAMSVIEQRRELALLRAVGATAEQTAWMVVVESLFLGLIGVGLGVLAGSLFAASFVQGAAVFMNFPAPFAFPLQETLLASGLGLLLAFFAALLPAWRAGRVPVVEGLRNE